MDDFDVRGFIRTVELGSIAKAAKDLFVTTQALDARLRKFETTIGVKLLEKSNKGISCTRAGRLLYEAALNFEEYMGGVLEECRRIDNWGSCTLRVGLSLVADSMPSILPSFSFMHPEIEVVTSYLRSVDDVSLLLDNGLDVVEAGDFLVSVDTQGLSYLPVRSEPMYCVFSRGHALEGRESVRFEDLVGETVSVSNKAFYLGQAEGPLRETIDRIVFKDKMFGRADILRSCMDGGVFLVPKSAAFFLKSTMQLSCAPLDSKPTSIGYCTRRAAGENAQTFIDFCQETLLHGR